MQLNNFLLKLTNTPELIEFEDTMAVIDGLYDFSPSQFVNGNLTNKAGQNSGSCKILAFGKLHGLDERSVVACFGRYYREDVLGHPGGSDHQNIRNFVVSGWKGVSFDRLPLTPKFSVA
ncbi:type III effector [Enterovibrio norvegicus FF-33]|uniref:Type III effector n=1 Tax=Enterovibrio norvegicus FF-454 TaxID=1185651 RepID=A0A1E5C4D9_9GAMM|nr:HopJ type III effector protein [Enterovibrio norvegicus]OEE60307.1 type III effector [Enterovibrio norvegicus FF-454]OEE70292.1 type III effector [Enterovibrio norvegicus FF-33]OEE86117.1 type III effector [Enterovibrio norvegicus FF-162]